MYDSLKPRGGENLKPVAQVVDPSMSPEARSRLMRKIENSDSHKGREALVAGFVWSTIGVIILIILITDGGVSWWWIFASALPILIGIASKRALSGKLDDRDYSHFVRASDLDKSSRELLFRAQQAIRSALRSGVYANNSLDHAVRESDLRRYEWEVAVALRKISKLRSESEASTEDGLLGPMTAAVLDSQRHALTLATDATTSRITALEHYAAELNMADAAERDWRAAMKASGRNDPYLDLIAETAADELAIAEIKGLTEQAAVAAEVFREHLYQVSLAAQALVLPTKSQD